MSTGLTIQKATYGNGTSTVDVTGAVSKKVKDGVLNFTVSPTSLGIEDPAPGQLKTIDISYTINDGSKNDLSKKDNDLVFIDAPPARDASGLQIVKAEYGYPGNWTEVTDAVQNLMSSNNSIDLKVGFKELGLPDPNPNKQKQLKVDYTLNGSSSTQTLKDGERFKLSAPPREGSDGKTPSQHVNSILWSLFAGASKFIGMFLHVSSILVSYDAGKDFVHPLLWAGLAFFIPFFGFLVFPFIIFVFRLFRSTNIVSMYTPSVPPA